VLQARKDMQADHDADSGSESEEVDTSVLHALVAVKTHKMVQQIVGLKVGERVATIVLYCGIANVSWFICIFVC
jgi:hypothetical protein